MRSSFRRSWREFRGPGIAVIAGNIEYRTRHGSYGMGKFECFSYCSRLAIGLCSYNGASSVSDVVSSTRSWDVFIVTDRPADELRSQSAIGDALRTCSVAYLRPARVSARVSQWSDGTTLL